jgi:hypothetical protein
MAVGREPAGYRLARLARERGWTVEWKSKVFDFGHGFGVAGAVRDSSGSSLARWASMKRSRRGRWLRHRPDVGTIIELRAQVAAALLEKLSC